MHKAVWIACVAVLAAGAGASAQDFIGGPDFDTSDAVTATGSTWDGGWEPVHVVDGSGLDPTGVMHSNGEDPRESGLMWLGELSDEGNKSGATDTGGAWIRFDFDQVYDLGGAHIWNHNGITARSMNQVIVEYSLTGGASDWTRLGGEDYVHTFPRTPVDPELAQWDVGDDIYTGFWLDLGGISAKSVVFTCLSAGGGVGNFSGGTTITGAVGLSEVRFYLPGEIVCDPGDADGDGDVDDDDLSLLLANWGGDVDCTKGEFSGVPPVNDDDLSLLLANWTGPLVAAVPEPATMALLALGAAAVLRRRRA